MPDSPAERARRARAHAKGDHVYCKPGRCKVLAATQRELDRDEPPETGPIQAALGLFANSLTVRDDDPRMVITLAAMKLARTLDEAQGKDVAMIARELRTYLSWMAEFGHQADQLDAIRSQRALDRVDAILATVKG